MNFIAEDYFTYVIDVDGRVQLGKDENGLFNFDTLFQIHEWVDEIVNDRREYGAKEIRRVMSTFDRIYLIEYDERFRYSENTCLFFETYRTFLASSEKRTSNEFAENLENLIALIRSAANQQFRARVASRKRSAVNNQRSAHELVDRLFDEYEKLHVIRLDLLLEKGGAQFVSVEDAHARLKFFLGDRRRDAIHSELVGYIWKLEYFPGKGVYFHVVLFLRTKTSQEHGKLVRRFGEYWNNVATGMKGGYIFIDERWARLRFGGSGEIKSEDQEKRKALTRGLDYIIYKDAFLQPLHFIVEGRKRMRTFGKSNKLDHP